jgi:hypothetical protein
MPDGLNQLDATAENIAAIGSEFERADASVCEAIADRFDVAILDAIRAACPGVQIDGGPGSMTSRYYVAALPGRESVEFRISNHAQACSGPVHSFETTDDARAVRLGLDDVVRAIQTADADDM